MCNYHTKVTIITISLSIYEIFVETLSLRDPDPRKSMIHSPYTDPKLLEFKPDPVKETQPENGTGASEVDNLSPNL